MQRSKFFLYLIVLSLSSAPMTAVADTGREKTRSSARFPVRILRAPIGTIESPGKVSFNLDYFGLGLPGARSSTVEVQQVGPRKYIIKPLNLGINSEIRARSTRSLQVRVTDENDRPVPDAPVLFLLSNGGTGSGSVGSFAGQTSLRAMTNSQGIAQVDYSAGEIAGSTTKIKAQVEGTDAIWEGTLLIISALVAVSEPQSEPQLTPQSVPQSAPQLATQPSPQSAPQSATQPSPQNAVLIFNSPVIGQMPKSSVARQTFTRTDGKKFTLQSVRRSAGFLLRQVRRVLLPKRKVT